jgi:transcriptional regulator of acetoin/glycerol metabolism
VTDAALATVFVQGVQPQCQILLAATNGNVTAAAKKLGISRRTLHRKINEMNLAKAHAKITEPSGSKE